MLPRKRPSQSDVERTAWQLDRPGGDEQTGPAVAAARALAPRLFPREQWRVATKDRMLHAATLAAAGADGRQTGPDKTTVPSYDGPDVHTAGLDDGRLGRVLLADVEPIDEARAGRIVDRIAELAAIADRTDRR